MTWEISTVVTVLGTAFAFLYLSLNLPEETRSLKFYLFREWVRVAMLIISFWMIVTCFFVTFEITNPENTKISFMVERWYVYSVIFTILLCSYFLIRVIIETVKAPIDAFEEFKRQNDNAATYSKKYGKYKGGFK